MRSEIYQQLGTRFFIIRDTELQRSLFTTTIRDVVALPSKFARGDGYEYANSASKPLIVATSDLTTLPTTHPELLI